MCDCICASFYKRYGYTFCSRRPFSDPNNILECYDCDFKEKAMSSSFGDKGVPSFFDTYKFHSGINEWLEPKDFKKLEKTLNDTKSYLYLTLSPDKFLRNLQNTEENQKALFSWCNNWFKNNPKYYDDYCFVVECGSKGDHLHVHAVVDLKTSHKHAENLKKSWAKHMPNNQLLTSLNIQTTYKCGACKKGCCKNPKHRGEYAYYRFDDELILEQKLDYFVNEKKGTHENLVDLNLRGSRGFLTDNS